MSNIDLNFAVEKHQHLMKVSRTEQILRTITRDILRKKDVRTALPTQSRTPEPRQTVVTAKGSQPA